VEGGIEEIIIVATPEGKPIYEDYFNNGVNKVRKLLRSQGKLDRYEPIQAVLDLPKITVIEQDPSFPYGNGSPFASAHDFVYKEDAFLAIYSDDVILGGEGAVKALIGAYQKNPDADAIIAAQEVEGKEIEKYASVKFHAGSQELETLIEKPKQEEAPSQLASYGRYLLTPKIFKFLLPENIGKDHELWTADAIDMLIKAGGKVMAAQAKGTWYTTGDPANYFTTLLRYSLDNESYAQPALAALSK
jgi:UTP--glucose-1-phosphate uridylyltransferase